MTPLEELQAAHKRLRDLRGSTEGKAGRREWRITRKIGGFVEIGDHYGDIVSTWDDRIDLPIAEGPAALIVTLHRTIDAQLAILDAAQDSRFGDWAYSYALRFARAINGGSNG